MDKSSCLRCHNGADCYRFRRAGRLRHAGQNQRLLFVDLAAYYAPQYERRQIVKRIGAGRELKGRIGPDGEKEDEKDQQFPKPFQIEIFRVREVLPQYAVVFRNGLEKAQDYMQCIDQRHEDVENEDDVVGKDPEHH